MPPTHLIGIVKSFHIITYAPYLPPTQCFVPLCLAYPHILMFPFDSPSPPNLPVPAALFT